MSYSVIRFLAFAIAHASNPEGVADLGEISVIKDGIQTSFNVIGASWMQRFGRVSKTTVNMRGGGRFYLAGKPPTNATWEPGTCMIMDNCEWKMQHIFI